MRNRESSPKGPLALSLRLSSAILMLDHADVSDKKIQLTLRQTLQLRSLLRECRILVDQERLF